MNRSIAILGALLAGITAFTAMPARADLVVTQIWKSTSRTKQGQALKSHNEMRDVIFITKGRQRIDSYYPGGNRLRGSIIDDIIDHHRIIVNWVKNVYEVRPENPPVPHGSALPRDWVATDQSKTILGYKARLYKWIAVDTRTKRQVLLMEVWVCSSLPADLAGRDEINGMYLESRAPEGTAVLTITTTSIRKTHVPASEFAIPKRLKRTTDVTFDDP